MVWLFTALLTVALFVAAIPARYEQLLLVSPQADATAGQLTPTAADALAQLDLSSGFYAAYIAALEAVIALVFAAVAAVIAWQRADDWIALVVALMLTTLGPAGTPALLALGEQHAGWQAIIIGLRVFASGSLVIFCFAFPDGRFVPASTRSLAVIWLLCLLGSVLVPALRPPVGVVAVKTPTEIFRIVWYVGWMGIGAYAQVYRYRRVSNLIQRQQTKWVVFGFLGLVLLLLAVVLIPVVRPALLETTAAGMLYRLGSVTFILLGLLLIPTSIGIASLRYRLFEIDVLINRTLMYGALILTLALVYWSSVVLLQQLFRLVVGQPNDLAIVASTLAIAALFQPLRAHIRRSIDRRFYRRKYDAAKTLQAFSLTLRDEVDLNRLCDDLMTVVEQTVQPSQVLLWLRDSPTGRR